MRYIVDTNFIRDEKLDNFLSSSTQNKIVLTEYVAIESYKGSTTQAIENLTEVIKEYPDQVEIAKCTIDLCGVDLNNSYETLIDREQTNDFYKFCQDLESFKSNKIVYLKKIKEMQSHANSQMERIEHGSSQLIKGLVKLEQMCNPSDIKELRKNSFVSEELQKKIEENIRGGTILSSEIHPRVGRMSEISSSSFIYRNNVCAQMLFLWWMMTGSSENIKTSKVVNDIIDINFATYALYFDGLLTNDRKLSFIYDKAKKFLFEERNSWGSL